MNSSSHKTCRFCRLLEHPWCPFAHKKMTVESPACGQFVMTTDPKLYKERKNANTKKKEEILKRSIEL